MSIIYYLVWFCLFIGGIFLSYSVPEETFSIENKFLFIAIWGAVLGYLFYIVAKRSIKEKENLEIEQSALEPKPTSTETLVEKPEISLPKSLPNINEIFPLEIWNEFCKAVLKNRPFPEVLQCLENILPKLFSGTSGILYMYGDSQSEMHRIFSYGEKISDDTMMPQDCSSFNLGEIVINDYSPDGITAGCTHLHYLNKGIALCIPIEGLEEHFGTLTIHADSIPEGESLELWKTKLSIVAATFGLYVANQNLKIRFDKHSIRDNLTGLFNKRYMEETLRREVFAAQRHKTPIGIIMLYPDALSYLINTLGRHGVEQLLWELSQRIPRYIRTEDIPCRYDGDVFCVILPGANYQITQERAEKIRHEISQLQVDYGGNILKTTLSMGFSIMPFHAVDPKTLIYSAEQAMKLAVQNGGDKVIGAEALTLNVQGSDS